jgi:RNA polymerase sigma factor (sigma-70 family)
VGTVALNVVACDGEAFAALYRQFYPRVLGLCRYFLGSRDEAEDASSEVFLRLPKALASYDRALPFSRWLSTVTGHYCLDRLRRRRLESRYFVQTGSDWPEPAAAGGSPLDDLIRDEEAQSLRAAVARLPQKYGAPLMLYYFEGLSYEEISARLGLGEGTLKTRMFRAKRELERGMRQPGAAFQGPRKSRRRGFGDFN